MYPRPALRQNNSSVKGFTLLELMIASGILIIVISGLLATFIHCGNLNQTNHNLIIAANDCQYVLEEMKAEAYSDLQSYINNFVSTRFTNLIDETVSFPSYSIGANIATITVRISWTERQRENEFELSTRIARPKISL